MNNSNSIEQQLLEEQLQAVTGGCGECINDKMLARQYLKESIDKQAAGSKLGLGIRRDMLYHQANEAQTKAEELLARVVQRHNIQPDPNHNGIQ